MVNPLKKDKTVRIVIPARFGSTRFPGKPLAMLGGRPLIQHVYDVAKASRLAESVCVATDDDNIADAVKAFGGEVVYTSNQLRTGTDRVAEVARQIDGDFFINLQSDEFISSPMVLDSLIVDFLGLPEEIAIGTVKKKIDQFSELTNSNVVKVVTESSGNALYFSRLPVPYIRDGRLEDHFPKVNYFKHFGIYIFRKKSLLRFAQLKTGTLEDLEKLEQLRALEAGMRIAVFETQYDSIRIDTPEDLKEQCAGLITNVTQK